MPRFDTLTPIHKALARPGLRGRRRPADQRHSPTSWRLAGAAADLELALHLDAGPPPDRGGVLLPRSLQPTRRAAGRRRCWSSTSNVVRTAGRRRTTRGLRRRAAADGEARIQAGADANCRFNELVALLPRAPRPGGGPGPAGDLAALRRRAADAPSRERSSPRWTRTTLFQRLGWMFKGLNRVRARRHAARCQSGDAAGGARSGARARSGDHQPGSLAGGSRSRTPPRMEDAADSRDDQRG